MNIGVISDTHGLIRSQALEALRGSDLIVHAGDAGSRAVLETLGEIAPVVVVRGNCDKGPWAQELPETEVVESGGHLIYLLHDLKKLELDPAAAGFRVLISGHSHMPVRHERQGILYLNPGSAGPRRFRFPVTVARLRLDADHLDVEIIELPLEC